jgi:hypothetical protein
MNETLPLPAGLLVLADVVVAMLASHPLCFNTLSCFFPLKSLTKFRHVP